MNVNHRLAAIAAALTPAAEQSKLVIVYPHEWSSDVQADFTHARLTGDITRLADIVEAQTGERPRLGGPAAGMLIYHNPVVDHLVIFETRADGPQ